MARVRSPKYPNYPLSVAIENIRKVYDADRTASLPREVIARHLGYSGLSGASDGNIATLAQYGFLERTSSGEMKVSQLAIDILVPEDENQRKTAINKAALAPSLFLEIWNHFEKRIPSDEALRTYLLRREFNDRAINPIMKSFAPTVSMMSNEAVTSLAEETELNQTDESLITNPEQERVSFTNSPDPNAQQVNNTFASSNWDNNTESRKAVFPVSEGDVTFIFPKHLTMEGIEELEDYLAVFLKKEKRLAKKAESEVDGLG